MKKIVDLDEWKDYYDHITEMYGRINSYEAGYTNATDVLNDWLNAQPDAEEKHGKWELKEDTYTVYANCTNCNEEFICEGEWCFEDWNHYMHYCPNCGARMDLGEKSNAEKS